MSIEDNQAVWVKDLIVGLCDSPDNDMARGGGERAWDTPLVGFANGADPVFEQYKTVIGPFHWTYVKETYGFEGYGCGLCQVGVPCESGIPEGIGNRF
jgi:hypothetical protein